MSFQNVGFSSTTIRALSGVYMDTYDDDAVLHCYAPAQGELSDDAV